jgi:hypothetical protein
MAILAILEDRFERADEMRSIFGETDFGEVKLPIVCILRFTLAHYFRRSEGHNGFFQAPGKGADLTLPIVCI